MSTFEAAKALFMQGVGHLSAGEWPAAEACFRESLRLVPDRPSTLNNLAAALIKQGKFDDARPWVDQARAIDPSTPQVWLNQGLILNAQGEFSAAVGCYDQALAHAPDHHEAWSNRGVALNAAGDHEAALLSYEQALRIKPDYAEAWCNQGVTQDDLGRHADALDSYQRAIELKPDYAEAWCNRGVALNELDRHDEALASYDKAIKLDPDYAPVYNNKGVALADLGREEEALACFSQALQRRPDDADAHWNRSKLLIARGDYRAGWEEFDYRWQVSALNLRPLASDKPRWQGTPSKAPLLLWAEQGLGDQILFGSMLTDIAALPQKKYVALDQRLIPLFQRSIGGFEYVSIDRVGDLPDVEEQLALGSLPRLLRPSRESFAAARYPYLAADAQRVAALRQQVARSGQLVCGVSWSSKRKGIGTHKSIDLAQMLAPLAAENLRFVNLQYGDTTTERDALHAVHGIEVQNIAEVDNFNDIDGLASLIEACDVVLTTSNSTAHLAGALGKTTLLLLPFGKGRLWYWYGPQGHSLWYPAIQTFTQQYPGQWQHPLAQIQSYLNKLLCS
jgi:tetratricopeptide (TPR) repeat protein